MFKKTVEGVGIMSYSGDQVKNAIPDLLKESKKYTWMNKDEIVKDMKSHLKVNEYSDDELFEAFLLGMGIPLNDAIIDVTYSFCIKCGLCCKESHPIHFTEKEMYKLARALRKTKAELKRENIIKYDSSIKMYYFTNKPCPLLNSKNLCSHYSCRPEACKRFPIFDTQVGKQTLYQHHSRCEITYRKAIFSGLGYLISQRVWKKE